MPKTDTTQIYVNDLEDVRQVLGACLVWLQARDLQEAQIAFSVTRPSPLTIEVERVKERFDGYFGDFLLAQHEADLAADDIEDADDELGPENGSEELAEASEELLSGAPLGSPKLPKQEGRRLSSEEV